jgi:hypothetical protein
VVFIAIVLCPISYLTHSMLGLSFLNSLSSSYKPFKFYLVFDYALVDSNLSKFFHYYSCALYNMATFHAIGHSNLTIMVDDSGMIIISEHCLCAMFTFQPHSLHISKDVSYDSNNFISSSLYQIPRDLLVGETMAGWWWPLSHYW